MARIRPSSVQPWPKSVQSPSTPATLGKVRSKLDQLRSSSGQIWRNLGEYSPNRPKAAQFRPGSTKFWRPKFLRAPQSRKVTQSAVLRCPEHAHEHVELRTPPAPGPCHTRAKPSICHRQRPRGEAKYGNKHTTRPENDRICARHASRKVTQTIEAGSEVADQVPILAFGPKSPQSGRGGPLGGPI